MKKSLLLCLLVAISGTLTRGVWAADPGDRFLEAYFLIIDGDAAERQSDWTKSETKYRAAMEVLNEIKVESPTWNPHILDFRLKYCAEHLDALRVRLAPPAPATPPAAEPVAPGTPATTVVEAPAETPVAPPPEGGPAMRVGDADKLMQLAADLQKAQNRISELETERTNLQTQLGEAVKKAGPLETNARIEELLKQNQDLAGQLAGVQGEMAKLRQSSGIDVTQTPDYLQLKTQLTGTQTELERTKVELGQTKVELATVRSQLDTVQTENRTLRASYEQVATQLTEANRRLSAAQTASQKDDEIIKQLRKENSLLQQIVERRSVADRGALPPIETYHELRGWKPRKPGESTTRSVITNVTAKVVKPAKPAKEESTKGKLVASVTAPPAPKPAKPAPAPATKPVPRPAPVVESTPTQPEPPVERAPEMVQPEPTATPAPSKATVTTRETAPVKEAPPTPAAPQISTLIGEARTAEKSKDYETAAARYNQVLTMDPNNLLAMSNLAVIRTQQGQLDEAESLLRKTAVQAPNDSASRSLLGVVYFKKGLVENAFGELTRAVALDPRNAQAHNYLGITLSEKGWATSAEQEIRKAVDLDPNYADAHFNLAVLYMRAKPPRLEMARYHYMKAIDLGAEPDPQIDTTLRRTPSKPAAAAPAPVPAPAPTP